MNNSLVSIIIPTYNRAHLIGETLDSILKQTYTNWECIVVDDGSSDTTDELLNEYTNKDSRIHYHHRPHRHLPGGNGARNYGLSSAKGDYVIFFDSDDLMTKDHVKIKVSAIKNSKFDYVVAKTKFIDELDTYIEPRYKKLQAFGFSAKKYLLQEINWLTYDACIKTSLAKSIQFNEELKSGQEFNYFSKLILQTTNAFFVDIYVTLRRKHDHSISSAKKSRVKNLQSAFISCILTYEDIQNLADLEERKALLFRCIDMIYKNKDIDFPYQKKLQRAIRKEFGFFSVVIFKLMVITNANFDKGYTFRKLIQQKSGIDNAASA